MWACGSMPLKDVRVNGGAGGEHAGVCEMSACGWPSKPKAVTYQDAPQHAWQIWDRSV